MFKGARASSESREVEERERERKTDGTRKEDEGKMNTGDDCLRAGWKMQSHFDLSWRKKKLDGKPHEDTKNKVKECENGRQRRASWWERADE